MATLTEVLVGVETLTCCECGLAFAVPREWVAERRRDHKTFQCPNGHPLSFPDKSKEEQLRDQLAREKHAREQADAWRREETERKERAQRQLIATKGVVTRVKRRIAHGVCPCCKRTFSDLARHMEGKHPDYVEAATV